MGCLGKLLVLAPAVVLISFVYLKSCKLPPLPTIEDKWWGPGAPQEEDTSVKPFQINVPNEVILDLKRRLNQTLPFHPPLEGVNQHYGMNTDLLATVVDYWKNQYDWTARQKFLNQFPQFTTNIQGLKIHFLRAKPQNVPEGVEVLPLLLLHGWPGSIREFYGIIPILTTPQEGRDFVFEIIAPSLPGYGFSDGASKPGMNMAEVAHVFNTLMNRLGFAKYYVQGGDWGGIVSRDMALLYPDNVIGLHRNLCYTDNLRHWKVYVGSLIPSLFFSEMEAQRLFPLSEAVNFMLLETGYFHIQATKPDTVGVALRESPAGLAAYILEKFTTGTNPAYKDLPDGGLTKKFTMEQLLDNLMIYWVTRSITTSMRFYSEVYTNSYQSWKLTSQKIVVPSGCVRFQNEVPQFFAPETILRETHSNLVHLTDYDNVGHFAALEAPDILSGDIVDFVVKARAQKSSAKEL